MHADYGRGSFIGVDGAEHTPGNAWGHLQSDPAQLTADDHEFEALGFEDCCDGHAELEVHLPSDQPTDRWRLVQSGDTPCLMSGAVNATCGSSTDSVATSAVPSPPPPPPLQPTASCPTGIEPCGPFNPATAQCTAFVISNCCCAPSPPPAAGACPAGMRQCSAADTFTPQCSATVISNCCCE
jgi:hypothetical protein